MTTPSAVAAAGFCCPKEEVMNSPARMPATVAPVHMDSGFCYGVSGVLIASRYCSAKTDYGSSYLMQALTAVVLGGLSAAPFPQPTSIAPTITSASKMLTNLFAFINFPPLNFLCSTASYLD